MNRSKERTSEFKAKVVLEVISGHKSQAEACREYKISKPLLQLWTEVFLTKANQLFEEPPDETAWATEVAELQQMVGQLTMELAAAKKVSDILNPASHKKGR